MTKKEEEEQARIARLPEKEQARIAFLLAGLPSPEERAANAKLTKAERGSLDTLLMEVQSNAIGLRQRIEHLGGIEGLRAFLRQPLPAKYEAIQRRRDEVLANWEVVLRMAEVVGNLIDGKHEFTCTVCGQQAWAKRSDALTCSGACRVWRSRHPGMYGAPSKMA